MTRTSPRSQSAVDNFLSIPELWINGVFNFLPFASIETLSLVSKALLVTSEKTIHPTHLGIFPIPVWSNHTLPLLDYKHLKKFQRVSQVGKRLTLSKSLSEIMFRSDVDASILKKIKTGTPLHGHRCKSELPGINPFFEAVAFTIGDSFEDIYISTETTFKGKGGPTASHGINNYKALLENATQPAVHRLFVEHFVEGGVFLVDGTGRPSSGGEQPSVTCKDVILGFVKDRERFHDYDGDRYRFRGFSTLTKHGHEFILSNISWGS